MPSVLISYSRRDKVFVERLHDALAARGCEVWVDFEDIPPSAEWFEEIRAGLLAADGVVFVISPDSAASEVCRRKLEEAVTQHKRIVPILHRDPGSAQVPQHAAALNWVFLRDSDAFDAGVDTVVAALETDLDHVRTHTRLGVDAARWQASARDRSQLLRGSELTAGEAWLVGVGDKEPQPTQLQREYLHASRQAATRRQRVLSGAVSLGLLVAIGLGVLALIQRNTAINNLHAAQAALKDTAAVSSYASDPQRSVADALQAAGIVASSHTAKALREALAQSHLRRVFNSAGGYQPDAIWSPDGTRLLVTSPEVSAKIYSPGTNAPPISLPPPLSPGEVAWDATGDRIVIGGAHPAVYDADTGRLVARLPGGALKVALSSNGTLAATTGKDAEGHVYDVATGRQLASFSPAYRGGVTCFAWAPDGSVIAQCDAQSTSNTSAPASLDLWDPSTGRLLHADHSKHFIASVAFSPDSSLYAYTTTNSPPKEPTVAQQIRAAELAAGQPGTFVYDTRGAALVKTFPGGATAAAFGPATPSGVELLGYATVDGVGHVYNFTSGLDEPLVGATGAVNSIGFSASGAYVVTGSDDGTARVYDESDGELLETLADGDVGVVESASFGLADAGIATASSDGAVRLWTSPQPQPEAQTALAGRLEDPVRAAFTSVGGRIVEAGLHGGEIIDANGLRLVARFSAPAGASYAGAAASHDGRVVAALAYRAVDGTLTDGLVQTFNGRTGRLLATIKPPAGLFLSSASLDETGTRLVTLYGNGDAQQWDPRTGRRLQLLRGSPPAALAVYSPDGATLAIVHEPTIPASFTYTTRLGRVTIDLWNARSGEFVRRLEGPPLEPLVPGIKGFAPLALAFSPNSKAIVLAGADNYLHGFATQSRGAQIALPVPNRQFASSVAFSPNSRLLAAGTAAAAYVWQLGARAELLPVFQHADPSQFTDQDGRVAVSFTRDSRILVTVGDSAIKAWDVADHLALFAAVTGTSADAALDPAGHEFVSAVGDNLSVYPCDLCGGLAQLLAVAKRLPTT